MKNQNDLIICIVAGVLAIGAALAFFFTKREPVKPSPPEAVPTARAQVQPGAVTYANSLPGGGNNSGGGGGFGSGGAGGGGGTGNNPPSFIAGGVGQGGR